MECCAPNRLHQEHAVGDNRRIMWHWLCKVALHFQDNFGFEMAHVKHLSNAGRAPGLAQHEKLSREI